MPRRRQTPPSGLRSSPPRMRRNPPELRAPLTPCEFREQAEILDATPPIVSFYSRNAGQLLLSKVRNNRLLDLFLELRAYPLECRVRPGLPSEDPAAIDELYIGQKSNGRRSIVVVQVLEEGRAPRIDQDLAFCRHAFPELTPRLVAVQFKRDEVGEVIVMFELFQSGDEIKLRDEKHYRLVPADQIGGDDLLKMAGNAT